MTTLLDCYNGNIVDKSTMVVFPSEFIPSLVFLQHQESNCGTNPGEKRSGKVMAVSSFSVSQAHVPVLCTLT